MSTARLALVGAPNCGKSTLFNGLTGGRAKVANYPGATVEWRIGRMLTPEGRDVEVIDLPGVYGLTARSRDEEVAVDALRGNADGGLSPDMLIVLVDAANLRTHLHTVLQMRALERPMIVALNMFDLATRDGLEIDIAALEDRLGVPVVASRATRKSGRADLLARIDAMLKSGVPTAVGSGETPSLRALQKEARQIAGEVITNEPVLNRATKAVDRVVLHPVAGPLVLAGLLFLIFQAMFSWSAWPMDALENGVALFGEAMATTMPEGWVRDLLVDGIIAGVGSVIVFLPQIMILFAFILLMEASGYMARAAFLMDELMLRVGLNGRAFIPLLSSFACAIPGIMGARAIENERDRLTTILIAPLMTCSARIPVYGMLIGAFVPAQNVGIFNLQGLVMFGLYLTGVLSAVGVAFALKRTVTKGAPQALLLELPTYKLPNPRDFFLGLWTRVTAFLRRAGTIILATSMGLWFLAAYPSNAASFEETFAGRLGALIEPLFRPIGFNAEIALVLLPGMAAREVAISSLGTVYAVQADDSNFGELAATLQSAWPLPTALAFLAWFVYAPQCFATLATIRRETHSWRWTGFAFGYLMGMAYVASGLVYWTATALGL